jgi:DNA-binding MarR family transcriptional regulator
MPESHQPITFLMIDVARLWRQRFDRGLEGAGLGLTAGEARALFAIKKHPNLRQTELAERMNVEPMTMCGYLDRLESAGLIERRADPADRRAKLVTPTARAEPLTVRIEAIAQSVRRKATAALTEDQVHELRERLAMMREALIELETAPEMEPA